MTTATETVGFTTFATPIGECAIAWGPRGLLGVALPGSTDRLRGRCGHAVVEGAPPPAVSETIDRIRELLEGEAADLSATPLDLTGVGDFDRAMTAVVLAIPTGETLTYGEVAERIGVPGEAREVGQALGRNRFPLVVPCHRVVAAGGGLGGFSAPGGTETKRRLLEIERPHAPGPPALF